MMRTARDNARVAKLFAAEDDLAAMIATARTAGRDPGRDEEIRDMARDVDRLRAAADDGADPFHGVVD
jgi:uncharacterized protein YdcH (DUF465 family)